MKNYLKQNDFCWEVAFGSSVWEMLFVMSRLASFVGGTLQFRRLCGGASFGNIVQGTSRLGRFAGLLRLEGFVWKGWVFVWTALWWDSYIGSFCWGTPFWHALAVGSPSGGSCGESPG